jgi:hypothetical protein
MKMSKIVMNSKVITSVSAFVLAMAFAGPVAAQTMIGGVEVSASDLPKVQEQCDRIAAGSATSLSTDSTNDSSNGNGGSASGGGTASGGTASGTGTGAGSSGASATNDGKGTTTTETGTLSGGATAINLASITAGDCAAAGLSSGAAIPAVPPTK